MAKFCSNCGEEINLESGFCPNCGVPVESVNNASVVSNLNTTYSSLETEKKDPTVSGFILSLLGFLCCTYLAIPGLIICIISLQNMNNGQISTKNKGLAIAGIILGVLGIIVMIINILSPNPEVSTMINDVIEV